MYTHTDIQHETFYTVMSIIVDYIGKTPILHIFFLVNFWVGLAPCQS